MVDADEQIEIRLESNPGTGYAWQVSAMTTTDLVALASRTYVAGKWPPPHGTNPSTSTAVAPGEG